MQQLGKMRIYHWLNLLYAVVSAVALAAIPMSAAGWITPDPLSAIPALLLACRDDPSAGRGDRTAGPDRLAAHGADQGSANSTQIAELILGPMQR